MARALDRLDEMVVGWIGRNGRNVTRASLAIIFIWFGALKPLGLSPAEELVRRTVTVVPGDLFVNLLGLWEMVIGVCFLVRPLNRLAIAFLFCHMPGTMLPLFLLPEVCYTQAPFALTLEGQYIIKNLALISGGLIVWGTLRRRELSNDDAVAARADVGSEDVSRPEVQPVAVPFERLPLTVLRGGNDALDDAAVFVPHHQHARVADLD